MYFQDLREEAPHRNAMHVVMEDVTRKMGAGEHIQASMSYRTTELGNYLTRGFQTLWETKQLFDCSIVVEGETFELHKGLLIALSPYFQSMFTSGFEEAGKSNVELKGVTTTGFSAVINFLYTQEIHINETNLQDIMEAAAHLQIPGVLNFCAEFIESQLSTSNCFDFLKLVHVYDHMPCQTKILVFIAKHCHIMRGEEFSSLPSHMVAEVLGCDELSFKTEHDVLKMALEWVNQNSDCSQTDILTVMSKIRYSLLPRDQIFALTDKCESLRDNEEFVELVAKAQNFQDDLVNLPNKEPKAQYRPAHFQDHAVMLIHYPEADALSRKATLYQVVDGHQQLQCVEPLQSLPANIKDMALVSLNDFVFVLGGEENIRPVQGYKAVGHVYRFDFLSKQWVQVASMNEARGLHGVATLGCDEIMVIGGVPRYENDRPGSFTKSVEVYNLKTNRWRFVADFPYKVCSITAVTVNNTDVYACGGTLDVDPRPHVNSYRLHMYDKETDTWLERSSMYCKKQWHVMVQCNNKIYVFGGVSSQDMEFFHMGQHGPFMFAKVVECYNPASNQWTLITVPNQIQHTINRPIGGGLVIKNTVYLLGQRRLMEYHTDSGMWHQQECEHSAIGVLPVAVRVPNQTIVSSCKS